MNSFLNASRKDIVDLEKLLTAVPAVAPEGGGDGETKKCAVLEKWLKENGFTDIQKIEAPDARVSSGVRPSLIATIPGKSTDAVWVMAHLDVVPTGDMSLWKTNPWECVEKDGKLYGRGVEDNQQGLVSAVFAALYYMKNGIVPEKTIKLLFVADEENGSEYGIIYLLEHFDLFKKQDLILIPDGGDKIGETIEIAEKNIMWMKVHVKGQQTHGSRPDTGANACLAACDMSLRLHNLEKKFDKKDSLFEPDYSTFQPTKRLSNVDSVNIIPGEDTFFMDCRILPCYSLETVTAEVNKIACEIEKEHKVKVDIEYPQKSESPATPVSSPVAQKLAAAIKKAHGIDAKFIGIGGGTVGAELRRKGFDAVVWSSMDETAHQPNEYCIIDNIIRDAETLVEVFR